MPVPTPKKVDQEIDAALARADERDTQPKLIPPGAVFDIRHDPRVPHPDRKMIAESLRRYISLKAQMKEITFEIDGDDDHTGLKDRIAATMDLFGVKKATYEAYSVSVRDGSKDTINRDMLLAHGVDPAIIDKCTRTSTFVLLDVRTKKQAAANPLAGMF
jgi:hypothetical protein